MFAAYILIQVEGGRAGEVMRTVAEMQGVTSVADVTGPYDVIVRAEFESLDDLVRLLLRPVQALDGVVRTITCPVLRG